MQRKQFMPRTKVTLVNRFNNEIVEGDIINEDEIEGKKFFVVKIAGSVRVLKLAKDAYTIKKSSN
jgi:hypothetical protein